MHRNASKCIILKGKFQFFSGEEAAPPRPHPFPTLAAVEPSATCLVTGLYDSVISAISRLDNSVLAMIVSTEKLTNY